jgi:hypothetical protein
VGEHGRHGLEEGGVKFVYGNADKEQFRNHRFANLFCGTSSRLWMLWGRVTADEKGFEVLPKKCETETEQILSTPPDTSDAVPSRGWNWALV